MGGMTGGWQAHGRSMAGTWQEHCRRMAGAWQEHARMACPQPASGPPVAEMEREHAARRRKQQANCDGRARSISNLSIGGTIKKINQGPVVTLNEFEPAAGIKV